VKSARFDVDHRLLWLILLAWGLACAGYLLYSFNLVGTGYPLDDAWIHQTYARNLGLNGEWAYTSGQPSSGSTSPFWSAMIALGYALRFAPKNWTLILGLVSQVSLMLAAAAWFRRRNPRLPSGVLWIAALTLLEWHLIWAALSGMEILLLGLLVCLALFLLTDPQPRYLSVGLLIGLGIWIRPDALSLLLPAAWVLSFQSGVKSRRRILGALQLTLGVALVVLPYLWFNKSIEGSFWPSTFYAKQAEYAILRSQPLLSRYLSQWVQPITGAGIILIPGALWSTWQSISHRNWLRLAPLIWAASFLGSYALRLPVTYQHGRYAMPVLPVLIVLGVEGLLQLRSRLTEGYRARILSRTWFLSLAAVMILFLPLGARAYAMDVAVIETEMVQTSQWIAAHTDEHALIAAHDIGALGYFGHRAILDLAGLISPEVIPILRNEAALSELLTICGADYLMTFPGWYPELTADLMPVFRSTGTFSPQQDGENMAVYRLIP
jgi:hypothetical protein